MSWNRMMPLRLDFTSAMTRSCSAAASRISKSRLSMSIEKVAICLPSRWRREKAEIPEIREAEERGDRLAERLLHGAEAQLDLRLHLILRQAIKPDVRPRVRGDGVTLGGHLLHRLGIGNRHAADHEKGCLGAVGRQRLENCPGGAARRTVVESDHHLAVGEQRLRLAVVLQAVVRAAGGVDGGGACHAKLVGATSLLTDSRPVLDCQYAHEKSGSTDGAHLRTIPQSKRPMSPSGRFDACSSSWNGEAC